MVRELEKIKKDTKKKAAKHTAAVCPPPTDGPPVKYFTFAPNDSLRCGQEVGRFLAEELLVGRAGKYINIVLTLKYLKKKNQNCIELHRFQAMARLQTAYVLTGLFSWRRNIFVFEISVYVY